MNRRLALLLGGATVMAAGLGAVGTAPGRGRVAAAGDTTITSQSITYFESRLARDPGNYMVAGRLVNRYILRFGTGARMEDIARAEALARELARTQDKAPALARLSNVLLMQHKFSEAAATARDAVAADSLNQDALGALADALLASGQYAEGEAALRRMRPGGLPTAVRHAQWLDASGHSAGAYAAMDRVCRQFVRSASRPQVVAWCLTQLAVSAHAAQGPEAAEALFRRANAAMPGYRGALEGLGALEYGKGHWRNAEKLYGRILSDAHPDLYLRMAEIAHRLGREAPRRAWESRFLRVAGRPENEALEGPWLALYFVERGDAAGRDTAFAIATREVTRRPTVESWDLLSWVEFRLGKLDLALQAARKAASWGVPSPTMKFHRAMILESLGQTAQAAQLRRDAMRDRSLLAPHVQALLDSGGHKKERESLLPREGASGFSSR
jgi:tetratricopeptide (TPR) repeat protein